MEKFIGTKIVQAEPAMKCWGHKGEAHDAGLILTQKEFFEKVSGGWEATEIHRGYAVVYEGGYRSWSPADVFEAAYRRTDGMNFGLALEAAKKGEKIARKGWNGKGMYVFLVHGVDFHTDADLSELDDQDVEVLDCLVMRTATGAFCPGWLASQTDMLADDWMILE